MTTLFNLYKSEEVELTIDSKMLMEVETLPGSVCGEFIPLTLTARGALDIATRILYAVWTNDPDAVEERVAELAKDIPTVYNLMERHRG
jgi:hypothetical protein